MKKLLIFIIITVLITSTISALVYVGGVLYMRSAIYEVLKEVFPEGMVEIGSVGFKSLTAMDIDEVRLRTPYKNGLLSVKLEGIAAVLSLQTATTCLIRQMHIASADVRYDTTQAFTDETFHASSLSPLRLAANSFSKGLIAPEKITINDITFRKITHNGTVTAEKGAVTVVRYGQTFYCQSLSCKRITLDGYKLRGEGGPLAIKQFQPQQHLYTGDIFMRTLSYGKLIMRDMYAGLHGSEGVLHVSPITSTALGGSWQASSGSMRLTDEGFRYVFDINMQDIVLERLFAELSFDKQIVMTGKADGQLTVKGTQGGLDVLQGTFTTRPPGGEVHIKDQQLLENRMNTLQQLDPHMAQATSGWFADYRYNAAAITFSHDEGVGLVFQFMITGPQGPEELELNYQLQYE